MASVNLYVPDDLKAQMDEAGEAINWSAVAQRAFLSEILNPAVRKEPPTIASKGQMTGMLGVYLTAAELTVRGFIVSPTSRNAIGADLLVTDQQCRKAWSVQVKTNGNRNRFWLLNSHAGDLHSDSHIYVFVNTRGNERPEYFVIPSTIVAQIHQSATRKTGSVWYWLDRRDMERFAEAWVEGFELDASDG
jgi:hypothetical protein